MKARRVFFPKGLKLTPSSLSRSYARCTLPCTASNVVIEQFHLSSWLLEPCPTTIFLGESLTSSLHSYICSGQGDGPTVYAKVQNLPEYEKLHLLIRASSGVTKTKRLQRSSRWGKPSMDNYNYGSYYFNYYLGGWGREGNRAQTRQPIPYQRP